MKNSKKPDLNAPRYRKSIKGTLNEEFIDVLKENVAGSRVLDNDKIKEIIKLFNEELCSQVIEKRDGIEIPSQIGQIFIGTCFKNHDSQNIDFKKSAEYGKVISHKNWESDQHLAKIFFTAHSVKYKFKNHELWGFNPTRSFKRQVSKTYPENWKKYIEISPKLKISTMFRKSPKIHFDLNTDQDNLDNYNEFDF